MREIELQIEKYEEDLRNLHAKLNSIEINPKDQESLKRKREIEALLDEVTDLIQVLRQDAAKNINIKVDSTSTVGAIAYYLKDYLPEKINELRDRAAKFPRSAER